MQRPVVVFAALLTTLLVAIAAPVTVALVDSQPGDGGPQPLVVSRSDGLNYLAIPGPAVQQSGYQTADLDVSTATVAGRARVGAAVQREQFDTAFASATNESQRDAAVLAAIERLERSHRQLLERRSSAIAATASGETSARAFARSQARIGVQATQYQQVTRHVLDRASAEPSYQLGSLGSRLYALLNRFSVLQGPATNRVADAASGDATPTPTYVETGSDGMTLAYAEAGTYVRQTYLGAQRQVNASDQFADGDPTSADAARERVYELYPELRNRSVGVSVFGPGGIYRVSQRVGGGELTLFLDGGSGNVFYESVTRPLAAFDPGEPRRSTNGSLAIAVERTHETGPMRVQVNDSDGDPVDAVVHIGGDRVGRTGDDGTLWTVEPTGSATVSARTGPDERVGVALPGGTDR